jgi:hypothetical protein
MEPELVTMLRRESSISWPNLFCLWPVRVCASCGWRRIFFFFLHRLSFAYFSLQVVLVFPCFFVSFPDYFCCPRRVLGAVDIFHEESLACCCHFPPFFVRFIRRSLWAEGRSGRSSSEPSSSQDLAFIYSMHLSVKAKLQSEPKLQSAPDTCH